MLQSVIVLCQNREKSYNYCIRSARKILHLENSDLKHPDLLIVTGEPSIGIDQAKTIINKMSRQPYQEEHIVTIIHPGELLTTEAQNALLKIIEEPPKYGRIFITTTHYAYLLPTLRSRCKIHYIKATRSNRETSDIEHISQEILTLLNKPLAERLCLLDKIEYKKIDNTTQTIRLLDVLLIKILPRSNYGLFKHLIKAKEMALKNVTPKHVIDYILLAKE